MYLNRKPLVINIIERGGSYNVLPWTFSGDFQPRAFTIILLIINKAYLLSNGISC